MIHRIDYRLVTGLIISLVAIAVVFTLPAIPQDPGYHQFADSRSYLGIQNFINVGSNGFFIAVGILGIVAMRTRGARTAPALRVMYTVFFSGIVLTGFGSAWYHLNPDNTSLMWDRIAMTIVLMSYFSIIIRERVAEEFSSSLFLPVLVILGVISVIYWHYTETQGQGDLRPYVLVQFLPVLLIPLMLVVYRSRYPGDLLYWLMLGLYVAAKLVEHLDDIIYRMSGDSVSGHTLKHIAAASAAYVIYRIWCLPANGPKVH